MIQRNIFLNQIRAAFKKSRIVCLFGPRESGKTTIAKQMQNEYPGDVRYFDFGDINELSIFQNLETTFSQLKGLIVIDEIQKKPDFFEYLRHLHDRKLDQKFLILSSASKELLQNSYSILASRIFFIEVTPFSLGDVDDVKRLWLHGGFPVSYLEEDIDERKRWLRDYVKTYVEQDISTSNFKPSPDIMRKLCKVLAYYNGQIGNYNFFGSMYGLDYTDIRAYINYLESNFMIRVLQPWRKNSMKIMQKNPKIYFRDSGLLHYFLKIKLDKNLSSSASKGASFEGFGIEEIIRIHQAEWNECYFVSIDNKFELDLFIEGGDRRIGFEFKASKAPSLTPSMILAIEDKELNLDLLTVIYPEGISYVLRDKIRVVSLKEYIDQHNRFR